MILIDMYKNKFMKWVSSARLHSQPSLIDGVLSMYKFSQFLSVCLTQLFSAPRLPTLASEVLDESSKSWEGLGQGCPTF